MTDNREQLAFRFPPGTRQRIEALRLERETITATMLRALTALERSPDARLDPQLDESTTQPSNALSERLAAIETRLDKLESASRPSARPAARRPKGDGEFQYPDDVRRAAVELRRAGKTGPQIADEIEKMTGKRPNKKSVIRQVSIWAEQLGLDAGAGSA
ncbi:hypothetical protein CCR96_02290 [Halochromatium roseum]|nr:hypothetical protein [Halochromatium roseum]